MSIRIGLKNFQCGGSQVVLAIMSLAGGFAPHDRVSRSAFLVRLAWGGRPRHGLVPQRAQDSIARGVSAVDGVLGSVVS